MTSARLIYDVSEKNADLYYATRFLAPDPFAFLQVGSRKIMVMNDLEIDRAKRQASVDEVWSLNPFTKAAQKKRKNPSPADILCEILRSAKIRTLTVPATTPFAIVDGLRTNGIKVTPGGTPFFPERLVKTPEEVRLITKSQSAVFGAMRLAELSLRASVIRRGRLFLKGRVLTSEQLRMMINVHLFEKGFVASDTIIACGRHSIDPHDIGSGPLKPHCAIIVDIYPRSMKTMYYGDATRTFCKGRAPDKLRRLYATVKKGQVQALTMIRSGVNGHTIHTSILALFEKQGYITGEKDGRMQGFFHSTGHGIGVELHEAPTRIGPVDCTLKTGNVVSVEPGLYYKDIGGVRIEDLVCVTSRGRDVLAGYPKHLEIR